MDAAWLEKLLAPYNPWWSTGQSSWEALLPAYERPIVSQVADDLAQIDQLISITGPRRVGKSTAVKQVIRHLIREQHVEPRRVVYFSFDDPELFASPDAQRIIFDHLVEHFRREGEIAYFFLDEIQRLPLWELFLKKYYDLKAPARFVVSGSASSPIFRRSQESLLGRIKDRHLLPFSYREFCQYRLHTRPEFSDALRQHSGLKSLLLAGDMRGSLDWLERFQQAMRPFQDDLDQAVRAYCLDGGFPEVWPLTDPLRKIEYLMEQQVRKVLYEDLMLLTQYRKPENVLRFFVYLLAHPGVEINAARISKDADVERRVVEENLPRLEMTDLILRIQRFSHTPLRVRKGNIKCYPVDPALRNAVLKTWTLPDLTALGFYAENLVVRELAAWPECIELSYFREKDREVDFVFAHGGNRFLPIEVKLRCAGQRFKGLETFLRRYGLTFGITVSRSDGPTPDRILYVPLRCFLLAG